MDEPINTQLQQLDASNLLAVIDHAIDELSHPRHQLATGRDQLALLRDGLRVDARLDAWIRQSAARLEREARLAQRNRHLTLTPDHRGSILIKGSLPIVAAEGPRCWMSAWRSASSLPPNASHWKSATAAVPSRAATSRRRTATPTT